MILYTLVTDAEHKSEFIFITDTPYLTLPGELWVSIVRNMEKIDRVIMAPHCIMPADGLAPFGAGC